jgi:hypothetical protein
MTTKTKAKAKKQPLAVALVEAGEKDVIKKPPATSSPSEFARRLVHHPDREIASAMIAQQATHEADQKFGAELARLRLAITDIDAAYKISCKILDKLEEKLAATPRYIKSGAVFAKKGVDDIQWKDWRLKDRILICVLLFFLVIAAGLGMGNVYANLTASGNAVFIEDPWIALMISALMPIASVSIKFVTNFMAYDRSRKRYALSIYTATGLAFVFWGIMFGLNNRGVASVIDWNSFDETVDWGFAFVWSQLLVEMLAASALFLAAEDIYMRYSPDMYIENLEYLEVDKALKEHLVAHEALREKRGQLHGRLVELEAQYQAFINERIVEYISLRAHHVATMNAHSNA